MFRFDLKTCIALLSQQISSNSLPQIICIHEVSRMKIWYNYPLLFISVYRRYVGQFVVVDEKVGEVCEIADGDRKRGDVVLPDREVLQVQHHHNLFHP